jgi:hypothetical protein
MQGVTNQNTNVVATIVRMMSQWKNYNQVKIDDDLNWMSRQILVTLLDVKEPTKILKIKAVAILYLLMDMAFNDSKQIQLAINKLKMMMRNWSLDKSIMLCDSEAVEESFRIKLITIYELANQKKKTVETNEEESDSDDSGTDDDMSDGHDDEE